MAALRVACDERRNAHGLRLADTVRAAGVTNDGPIEDDPNLSDRRFPGNLTRSYRTRDPLRVGGEVTDQEPHRPEVLQQMRDRLARLKEQGAQLIDD